MENSMKLKLENIKSEKAQELANLIRSYNRANREPSKSESLNIYIEDDCGNLIAGIVVRDDVRRQGLGSKILKMAELESFNRGCQYSFVNTFHFQAPEFYEKHGYKEVFALKEYPYTGKRYYYTKEL